MSAVPQGRHLSLLLSAVCFHVLGAVFRKIALASFTLSSLVSTTASMPPCFSSFSYSRPRSSGIPRSGKPPATPPVTAPTKRLQAGQRPQSEPIRECQGPNACQKARYAA